MAVVEISNDFGRYLQAHRRSKEISLEAVAQKTKIRMVILEQIENEELDKLPTPTIAKGFIRAFAESVGAEPHEALQRYAAGLGLPFQEEQFQTPRTISRPFWGKFLAAILILCALIFITLFLADRFHQSAAPSVKSDAALPSASVAQSHKASYQAAPAKGALEDSSGAAAHILPEAQTNGIERPSPMNVNQHGASADGIDAKPPGMSADATNIEPPASPATDTLPSVDKWVLQVRAIELTWLKIRSDNGEFKEMTLHADEQVSFKADSTFEMLIGNAAGIRLELNDKPIEVPGGSGEVVSLKLP